MLLLRCRFRPAALTRSITTASTAALRERLALCDCCALCDASSKKARVVTTVKPLRPGTKMAGVARTVKLRGDFLTVVLALREAQPGDVLMIDASIRTDDAAWPLTGGMFGELLAAEAQRKGVAGLVIDGNCRDTPATLSLDIPIFSRGTHPNAGYAAQIGQTQCNVQMGGVTVCPGDFVLGDDDGVVVASAEELLEWLPKAESIQAKEAAIFEAVLKDGRPLLDVMPELANRLPSE